MKWNRPLSSFSASIYRIEGSEEKGFILTFFAAFCSDPNPYSLRHSSCRFLFEDEDEYEGRGGIEGDADSWTQANQKSS
jgi:hypothetical protein